MNKKTTKSNTTPLRKGGGMKRIIIAVMLSMMSFASIDAADLSGTFGNLWESDQTNSVVNIVSGPRDVTMNRDSAPGKEWIASSGGYAFKLTIEQTTSFAMTVDHLVSMVAELPGPYMRALKEVSEDGENGLAIYFDIGGATAHGGKSYINMAYWGTARTVLHEAGHTLDQVARFQDMTVPDLEDLWPAAIASDSISVSGYGDRNWWEDLAEFSKTYAICLAAGTEARFEDRSALEELQRLSPARFSLWGIMLYPRPVATAGTLVFCR